MENLKQRIFADWHLMRWLRLLFGIIFIVQAVQMKDLLVGLIAGFFLVTALTNTGCCGSRSCATPRVRKQEEEPENISYDEIK